LTAIRPFTPYDLSCLHRLQWHQFPNRIGHSSHPVPKIYPLAVFITKMVAFPADNPEAVDAVINIFEVDAWVRIIPVTFNAAVALLVTIKLFDETADVVIPVGATLGVTTKGSEINAAVPLAA
jgi:hypothetical protein